MPSTTNNDEENTFEVQAGARRQGGRGRGSRGARQHSAQPSERGAPDHEDASSSGAWSSGEEEEEEEDLFPDVTLPEPDDVVRIRQSFVSHYVPVFLEGTPQWLQQHPIFLTTEPRLGVVCPEDDPALDGRLDDEVHEGLVPVRFYCVDDRASAVPFRRIELVPEEAVEVLFRPFTASEVVVAEGDTGVIDDVELDLYVKPVPFPASLAAFAPPQLRERLTIATMKDYTSLADLFESDGSGGDRKKSHGRGEHHFDPSSVGAPSMADDAEMPSTGGAGRGKRGAKGKFKASKKVVTERELKMRKRVLAAARDPNRQSFEDFVDSCIKVPTAQFAPLSPFRPEVCVVHRHSQLVGMVVEVIEATLVAFDCGVVAVTTDFAGWNTAMTTEPSHDNRQSAFVAPGQRCRFESVEGCGTIIGSFDPEQREGCWEGTVITAVPYIVRCAFTTDAGVTWDDGGVDCHPADLFPLDLYYPEFVTVYTPGIIVDPAFRRDVIGAAMEEGVRSAVERGEVTLPSHTTADDLVDALKSHREGRENALKARREAAAARPGENVEEVEQHLLQLNAAAALEEEIEKAATTYDGNGPPPLSKDGLAKVLEHTCRNSADDGAAICGSLSTLEYATLHRMLQPPTRLPPSASDTESNATDEAAECRGQWQALLQGIMRFLPNIATVRFAASKVTVAWNSGRMDHAKDSREVLLRMEAPESEAVPPPEVLRLVAPAGARRYTFPIEFKDPVTERVGEYDLADLPAQHHAAMPGDVVMLKCKDDFDRDASYPAESLHEPSRIIGRVLESQERDRVCVVHWAPSALEQDVTDRDTFPSFSVPPQDPALCERIQLASRALEPLTGRLLVGGVVRMLNDGRAVIRWWDDTVETLPAQMLQVVEFQELSSITGGEGEEEEEDDGEADDEGVETAGATGPEDASQTAAPPQGGVTGLLTSVVRRAAEAVSTMVKNTRGKADEVEGDDVASSHGSSAGGDADDGAATGIGENKASGTEEAHRAAAAAAADDEGAAQAASADVGTFDIVPHFTSHLLQPEDAFSPAEPKRFYKRLQTEWRKLQKEVPPGVMVKVSEEDMHLMKLLIRGPVHTPYYQGAYAFDVFFPPEFPAKPPTVKHHAYRIRMNPNLYENGYVCLSLLGTWEGRDACEEWNPVNSSVLQLVHALQAMVLNKEPYFNEPGFEEGKGTERARSASRFANEAYYLLKLEHMAKMAHSPPPDWAFEVRRHVAEYAPRLFARADKYVALGSQAPAGAAEGSINSDGLVLPLTRGFHVSLSRQLAALRENVGKLIAQWEKDAAAFTDVDDGTSSPR